MLRKEEKMFEYVETDDICRCTYFKDLDNGMYSIFLSLAHGLHVDQEES